MNINKLPIVGAEEGRKPKHVVQYTLDGEVLCKNVMGSYIPLPLRTVALDPGFDLPVHVQAMSRIHALIEEYRTLDPQRQVPLPVGEIERFQICDKSEYKTLVEKGLLKEALIPIVDTTTGKNMGTRRLFYFTPQGRAFIRKYVDRNYALTEQT